MISAPPGTSVDSETIRLPSMSRTAKASNAVSTPVLVARHFPVVGRLGNSQMTLLRSVCRASTRSAISVDRFASAAASDAMRFASAAVRLDRFASLSADFEVSTFVAEVLLLFDARISAMIPVIRATATASHSATVPMMNASVIVRSYVGNGYSGRQYSECGDSLGRMLGASVVLAFAGRRRRPSVRDERGDGVLGDGAPVSEVRGHHDGDERAHQVVTCRTLCRMVREIVLGDLWGIEEGVWVQLWSGTVGAIVSAGVAALVAILVLTRSSRTQLDLVEKQLTEQRLEASRARARSATAEFVASVSDFRTAAIAGVDAVKNQSHEFVTAAYKWQLEMGTVDEILKLLAWDGTLVGLALRVQSDPEGHSDEEDRTWDAVLEEAISVLFAFGLSWNRDVDDRRAVANMLEQHRLRFENMLESSL